MPVSNTPFNYNLNPITFNLGNIYQSKYHGGTGWDEYNLDMSKTFQALDSDVTKLIITPKVTLSDYDGVEYNEGGSIRRKSKSINSKEDITEFKINEIIVEIEK